MKTDLFQAIKDNYKKNQDSVSDLMNFDRTIIDFCISHLEKLEQKIIGNQDPTIFNSRFLPSKTITQLKKVKEHNSMRMHYESIYNQCIVLSVSHFSSTIHSIFTKTMNYACKKYSDLIVASNEEIKITFNDLKNHKFDISENIGELVVKNKSISFQDMQSVQRAFEKYFGIQLERDEYTNDIIFALASRHIIVHKSAVVDSKFEQQIKDANNRDIKVKLELDQKIQFETSEVEMVQNSMNIYINNLINKINDKISVMEIDAISID